MDAAAKIAGVNKKNICGWDQAWVPGQVVWVRQGKAKGWWPAVVGGPRTPRQAESGGLRSSGGPGEAFVRTRLLVKATEKDSAGCHLLPFDDPRLPSTLPDIMIEVHKQSGKAEQLTEAVKEAKLHVAQQSHQLKEGFSGQWKDVCWRCDNGGYLICCDLCPGEYCFSCLGLTPGSVETIGDWYCGRCRSVVMFLLGELLALHWSKSPRTATDQSMLHLLKRLRHGLKSYRYCTISSFQRDLERQQKAFRSFGLQQIVDAVGTIQENLTDMFGKLTPYGQSPSDQGLRGRAPPSPSNSSVKKREHDKDRTDELAKKRVKSTNGRREDVHARGDSPTTSIATGKATEFQFISCGPPANQRPSSVNSPMATFTSPAGRVAIPVFPFPSGGLPLSLPPLPKSHPSGVVPLLPRPSLSTVDASSIFTAQHLLRTPPPALRHASSATTSQTLAPALSQPQTQTQAQPLEVRSVSVGPNGVCLALDEGRVMQLRRAEDLAPLYAHALAQLRAACDLLVLRERELVSLRASSSAASASAPSPGTTSTAPSGAPAVSSPDAPETTTSEAPVPPV